MQKDLIDDNEAVERVEQSFTNFYDQFIEQLPDIAVALVIIVLGYFIARLVAGVLSRTLSRKSHDPLLTNFITRAIRYTLYLLVAMLALNAMGLSSIATGLFSTLGASALILGFAFKDIGENFIAGVILAFDRPFDLNDTVKVDSTFGRVKEMNLRHTRIKTPDGRDIYIPNADVLKKPVENYTRDGFYRLDFTVGIAYEDSITKAKKLIQQYLDSASILVHNDELPNIIAEDSLGVSTMNLKVYFWIDTRDYRQSMQLYRGEVIREIKEMLEQNGFYLPADIQELKVYGAGNGFPVVLKDETTKS